MIFIRIKFVKEQEKINYQGVQLITDSYQNDKIFFSDNFIKDWYQTIQYIFQNLNPKFIYYSDNIDEFILTTSYIPAYGVFIENEFKLIYELEEDIITPNIIFYVNQYIMTWNELKNYI